MVLAWVRLLAQVLVLARVRVVECLARARARGSLVGRPVWARGSLVGTLLLVAERWVRLGGGSCWKGFGVSSGD